MAGFIVLGQGDARPRIFGFKAAVFDIPRHPDAGRRNRYLAIRGIFRAAGNAEGDRLPLDFRPAFDRIGRSGHPLEDGRAQRKDDGQNPEKCFAHDAPLSP